MYESILIQLDKAKTLQHKNSIKDALGETALKNKIVPVINDKTLLKSIIELGGKAVFFESFQKTLS